ncbi:metallophosphoesterase [Paenibacillus filicis]|uniref:Metallophosphoesterase n=1 Tax=Paenibacillus gyeongsangnamensis TaxID=3388067 RepID=A0ABT4Q5W8_9BACL|nr:metallophosphoesterase [Paenibacillus filicis]MCZ8512270.1 metallophosphoesterase [Paenibacillus filicis]
MRPRAAAVISFVLILFLLLQAYIGWHGWLLLSAGFGLGHAGVYWTCFWIIALSYLLARLGSRFLPSPLHRLLKWVGSYWFAVFEYGVLLLPPADLVYAIFRLTAGTDPAPLIRTLGLLILGVLAVLLIRGSWNAWNPVVRRYEITVPKYAGGLSTLRIAAASDLHLGTIVGNRYLRLLVDKVNDLNPDLILLPGDVLDDEIGPFIRYGMADIIKELRAPYGTYAVLGNHEYIGGHVEEYAERMKAIGIEVLMDKAVTIGNQFVLIGRKDKAVERFRPDSGRLTLEQLLEGVDRRQPLLLMDHQPSRLDLSAEAGIDLSLSGHTHRGQMAPNHWITKRIFELDWGYLRKGNLHAIVSSGYGTWGPPIRIGSRSEILEIIVHFNTQEE